MQSFLVDVTPLDIAQFANLWLGTTFLVPEGPRPTVRCERSDHHS
jgi:hypothetical protein